MKKNSSIIKKLVNLGKSQYVCLHAPFLRMMGLEKGDRIAMKYERGKIVISKALKGSKTDRDRQA